MTRRKGAGYSECECENEGAKNMPAQSGYFRFVLRKRRNGGTSPPVTKALTPQHSSPQKALHLPWNGQGTDSALEVGELTLCRAFVHYGTLSRAARLLAPSISTPTGPASTQGPIVASAYASTHDLAAVVAVKDNKALIPHLPLLSEHTCPACAGRCA